MPKTIGHPLQTKLLTRKEFYQATIPEVKSPHEALVWVVGVLLDDIGYHQRMPLLFPPQISATC